MKPVTKFFVSLVVCAICAHGTAQNLDPPNVKTSGSVGQDNYSSGSSSASSSGLQQNYFSLGQECGMYLQEEWKLGSIEMNDGLVYSDRMIRYNVYHQQMEFAWGGDTAAIGNPEEIASLTIDSLKFVYREFICNNKVRKGYLELLVDGDYELLFHRGIKYRYDENPFGSETGGPVTRYYQDNRYFLSCKGEIAEQLPEKKSAIIAKIDGNEKELKDYIKQNKCKLKTQDELVNFFVFTNNR